ncbi:hypothetical protein [Haloplanus salinarum]|uniref:hypothetical protein n=1 Tax=Haloplanus salinarum TaxID=1912324 RepID=UPI00214B8E9B|nr:hypothetical protein [Haloplanus salinarum]
MSDDSTTPDDGTDGTESGPADPPDGTPGGLSKRTLIRLLVGFGIGIPLLVEGLTFLGLLRDQFGGSGGDDADGSGSTPTAADDGDAVGVGDDMLPETDRSETLSGAVLRESGGDRWPLSLTVDVTNTGSTDYEFQLLDVHLEDGRSVDGRTSTDRLAPEENRTVTAERSIPAGSTPAAVSVVALIYREEAVETVERRVDLAKIPVRGG